MRTIYSSDELKKYLNQGERQFIAGNKKMATAFNVYRALGSKGRNNIISKGLSAGVADIKCGLVSEPTLIALALMFCTTIIAVVLILSGRRGSVTPTPNGPVLEVE